MEKRWSKTELTHLKRNAANHSAEELAQRLDTNVADIRSKLVELGLSTHAAPRTEASLGRYAAGLALLARLACLWARLARRSSFFASSRARWAAFS